MGRRYLKTYGPLSAEIHAMVPTADGRGMVSRKQATVTAEVDVFVDEEKLIELARRALQNKSGRTVSGAIEIRVNPNTKKTEATA